MLNTYYYYDETTKRKGLEVLSLLPANEMPTVIHEVDDKYLRTDESSKDWLVMSLKDYDLSITNLLTEAVRVEAEADALQAQLTTTLDYFYKIKDQLSRVMGDKNECIATTGKDDLYLLTHDFDGELKIKKQALLL